MMRTLPITALLLCVAAPSIADDPDRTLTSLLLQHHDAPTRAVLERHVPNAKGRLIAIATDEAMVSMVRDRAIQSLASWPDPDVKITFERLLARPTGRRHRVLLAYAAAFPRAAVMTIGPVVEGPDVELALTAITALATVPSPDARNALKQRARVEIRPRIKAALQRAAAKSTRRKKK